MSVLEGLAIATGIGLGLILLGRVVRGPRPVPAAPWPPLPPRDGGCEPLDEYPGGEAETFAALVYAYKHGRPAPEVIYDTGEGL